MVFQSDGTSTTEFRARVRVQSDSGVRQYGVLPFPYQASVGGVEVQDVRVTKPNGSVVSTPLDSIQDMTSEVSRKLPCTATCAKSMSLSGTRTGRYAGYSVRWQLEKPLATGQFWIGYKFRKNANVLNEQLARDQCSA